MRIRLLEEDVASQIAAGEVVERPSSVVKELLENSLDAGASEVKIRVEDAGKKLIEVADNGAGILHDELELAVARHATSKLRSADELFAINSLGFRGEALASIGSVSKLTIVSGTGDDIGGRILVEGGKTKEFKRLGVPNGTVISVENLFFNVPARLKFLKSDATERNAITSLVTKYALAYPNVRIDLSIDGKTNLHTTGNGDTREVLIQALGLDIAKQMLTVQQDFPISIHGYISPTSLTKPSRREITFFVNGRWVQEPALTSALVQAYHTYLMVGRYPLAVINIQLSPEDVDVNVHPAKAEVRFRKPDEVYTSLQRAVRRALMAYSPVPMMAIPQWNKPSIQSGEKSETWDAIVDSAPGVTADPIFQPQMTQQPKLPDMKSSLLRVVGQLRGAYIIAEGPDGLYLIDQHAAHERILFEKMQNSLAGKISRQTLLQPQIMQLDPMQTAIIESQLEILEQYGFRVEPFGPLTFRISEIPAILSDLDVREAIMVLIEDFEENETPLAGMREARLIARICKRAAIKAGKHLTTGEMERILDDLQACQSPRACPHGRPTMIHLSVDMLERQFGRLGSR